MSFHPCRMLLLGMISTGCCCHLAEGFIKHDPDEQRDTEQIVREHGYPIEPHRVTTEDGYILTAFRIPHGIHGPRRRPLKRHAVLLQHALLCSSFDWVAMSPGQSLGYILADAGFDVWMGNNRGNTYSKGHVRFQVNSAAFWNFTYDDMALYDLPANVNYILQASGSESLSYIGHSQGTMQGFAGFSLNSALAAKVNLFVALAPVAYVHHMTSPVFRALAVSRLGEIMHSIGQRSLFPKALNKIGEVACGPLDHVCNFAISLFCGRTTHINVTRLPVFLAHTPAGTSWKNMVHFAQGVRQDVFQMYNYGSAKKNLAMYGRRTPPPYNLNRMTVKTALFTGGHDILADAKDVTTLVNALPARSIVHQQHIQDYGHLDFAWGKDANSFVYPDVVKLLNDHVNVGAAPLILV